MHRYADGIINKINQSMNSQMEKLCEGATKLADCVEKGGVLHVLGSGHSHMIAEEIFYRAGGPLFVNPVLDPGLMLHNGALKSTRMERLPGYANTILADLNLSDHDIFLVVSNSGRNILPLEATYYMLELGIFTISISSFAHSKSVQSRHSSGKRLFELTDIALDNHGEIGDAFLTHPNISERYGPTSSVVGIVLVQTLISMTIEELAKRNVNPPLMKSANLDDSDEQNRVSIKKYMDRIPMLR